MKNLKESFARTPLDCSRFLWAAGGGSLAGAALLLGLLACPGTARAEYTVTYEQVGSTVVATGSGTIDTAGLTYIGPASVTIFVDAAQGKFANGSVSTSAVWDGTLTGPTNFGSGTMVVASGGTGVKVGLNRSAGLWLPVNYVSGSTLSDGASYSDQTLASLGLTPGDYTWTWGSGPTADSFNMDIGVVPEPTSVALFGLGGLALLARRQTRQR